MDVMKPDEARHTGLVKVVKAKQGSSQTVLFFFTLLISFVPKGYFGMLNGAAMDGTTNLPVG